jgi:hypothetical protein
MKLYLIFAWLLQQQTTIYIMAPNSAIHETTFPAILSSCIHPNRLLVFLYNILLLQYLQRLHKVFSELSTLNNSITFIKLLIN